MGKALSGGKNYGVTGATAELPGKQGSSSGDEIEAACRSQDLPRPPPKIPAREGAENPPGLEARRTVGAV